MKVFNNIKLFLALLVLVFSTGCSDIKLSPYDDVHYSTSSSGIDFCTTPADTIKSNLKFIFIVDRSGSNQIRYDTNDPSITFPGTDPTGARRFDALLRFVDSFQDDPYIHWSMVNFSSDANLARSFTNNKQEFYNFVEDQRNNTAQIDAGSTNYISALTRLHNLIENDIQQARNSDPMISSNYVVFFISDGEPIVQQQTQDGAEILGRIESIKVFEEEEKMLVEGIQVNSAYYYEDPISLGARDLLNGMSITGGGDFLEFGAGQEIDFSRFAIPIRISRFALKDIWITNANVVWEGNILVADSDSDGLSDRLERELGSDPYNYDSDGNGVGDGVEYRMSGRPCADANCSRGNANPYTTCRTLATSTNPMRYPDSDKDYLNDCEEKLLGSDRLNPDTNSDYIPDWIAFVNQIQLVEGTSDIYTDPDNDGLNNYQELKRNTPIRVHNDDVTNLIEMTYTGRRISTDEVQDCYSYSIQKMPFHSYTDNIRVFVFENTKSINEKIIYKTAEKQITPYGNVNINEGDFR